jgi:hypothetical protein
MLLIAWIIGAVFGIGIGGYIATKLKSKCIHKWNLIQNRELHRYSSMQKRDVHVGYFKIYECEHCKKMKKEQIEID